MVIEQTVKRSSPWAAMLERSRLAAARMAGRRIRPRPLLIARMKPRARRDCCTKRSLATLITCRGGSALAPTQSDASASEYADNSRRLLDERGGTDEVREHDAA